MKTRLRTPILRPLAIVVAAASVLASAHAADWEVAAGDWALATNWNPDGVPNGVAANISNAGTATISTVIADVPTLITIGSGAGNSGTVNVTAGSVGVAVGGSTTVGHNGGAGALNVTEAAGALGAGSITTGTLGVGGSIIAGVPTAGTGTMAINTTGTVTSGDVGVGVGAGALGNVTMDAGTWNITAGAGGGFGIGVAGGVGNVTLNGGTVSVIGATAVGFQGGTGTLKVLGTSSMGTGDLFVGDAGGTGAGTMTVNTTGTVTSGNASIGAGGTGTVNVEAGNWNVGGTLSLSTGGSGTVNLIGGTTTVTGATTVGATGTGNLNVANTAGVGGALTGFAQGTGNLTTSGDLNLGQGAGNTGVLKINTSGTITSAGVNVGNGGTGNVLMDSGAWSATGMNVGVAGGTGALVQGGGTISVTNGTGDANLRVGDGVGSVGTLQVDTAASLTANIFEIGMNGGSGTLNIGPGSTITALSWINFGSGDANASVNQTGGTLNIGSWGALGLGGGATAPLYEISGGEIIGGGFEVGSDRTATMNVTGTAFLHPTSIEVATRDSVGTMNISSANAVVAPGSLVIGSRTVNAVGTVNLNDGTIAPTNGTANNAPDGGLTVGNVGKGTLIQNGGVVSANDLNIAGEAGGQGTYNYNAGTATVGELFMGNGAGANGTLNIAAGQNFVHNGWAEVGRNGGTAVINVTGADAKFTHVPEAGDFQLGYNGGNGRLNVTAGGSFSYGWWLNVARGAGSVGNVLVDGAGSKLTVDAVNENWINVGEDGQGTMTISNGGIVDHNGHESARTSVGRNAGSTGTLNVNTGSRLEVTELFAGFQGGANGVVNIQTGGQVLIQNWLEVGSRGGVGAINIDGAGSRLFMNSDIYGRNGGNGGDSQIGHEGGNGTVNVANGGTFETNWWLNVARGVGSVGTINVDGAGSKVLVGAAGGRDSKMNIGEDGTGIVNVINGGFVQISNPGTGGAELYVGRNNGSNGTLNINTGGAVHANGSWAVIIGEAGSAQGTVNLDSGGALKSNNWIVAGNNTGTTGTINISDSLIPAGTVLESGTPLDNGSNEGRLVVGRLGTATLNQSGGTVRVDNWLAIGIDPGGVGTYNMSGGKIELYQPNWGDRNIVVANRGTGTMNITYGTPAGDTIVGGTVDAAYGTSINQFNVGADAGGVGVLNIDIGVGNKITHRELYAGWQAGSSGTININSGTLETTGWVELGRGQTGQGGIGIVNVIGPDSRWERGTTGPLLPESNARDINVGQGEAGNLGKGYINVLAGGTMRTNWWINLARQNGAEGHILVDGTGSKLEMIDAHLVGRGGDGNSQLNVGEGGTGTLTITNGGVFNHNMDNGGGEVWIARNNGSSGTMTIDGAGSQFNSKGREFRVANDSGPGGTLNIANGGVLNFTSTNEAGAQVTGNFGIAENNAAVGTINMDNGTLNITAWSMFSAWQDNAALSVATINATNSAINLLPGPDHGRLLWGRRGEATINQSGGTFLVSNWAVLGVEAGGRGRLNMTDAAVATFNNELNVGRAGGIGSVSLDSGSMITVAGEVFVGRDGNGSNGSFTVTGGSTAQLNSNLAIGQGGGGSTGVVNVTGPGTTMNVNGWTTLGRDTGGVAQSSTLNVSDGAVFNHLTLNSGDMLIGWQAGSTGAVNVSNGGKINQSWWTRFGIDPGSVGTGVVDGAGSEFNVTGGRVYVGERAIGTLTITNGGKFTHTNADQFNIGGSDGGGTGDGHGTVTVDGATSLLSSNNFIRVGHGNTGADPAEGILNVSGGGSVTVGGWLGIGHEGGDGVLNMDSGTISTGNEFYVGVDDNGHTRTTTGTANVSGGTINVGNEYIIGRNGGIGTMTMTGGTLNVAGWVRIGQGVNGRGTVTVDGVGTQANFNANGDANVGIDGGVGVLNVTNGGTVVGNQWLNIARAPGSTGTVTVDGAGSSLTTGGPFQGFLNVGEDGSGTLNVTNGGTVTHLAGTGSDRYMDVGRNAGAVGTVNVSGGATLVANNWLRIGAENVGAKGTVTVDSSFLTVNGQLRVGNHGEGTLNATGTADLTLGNGGQNHYVGTHNAPNIGTFNIADNALVKTGNGSVLQVGWAANTEEKVGQGVLNHSGGLITSVSDPAGTGLAPFGDYLAVEFARGTGSTGTHNISGGTELFRSYTLGGSLINFVAPGGGTATASQTGGNVKVFGEFNIGFRSNGATYTIDDGVLQVGGSTSPSNATNNWLVIGRNDDGVTPTTGTLTQNGGLVNHIVTDGGPGSFDRSVRIGNNAGATGTYNLHGGTFQSNGVIDIGHDGAGIVNQDGGVINPFVGLASTSQLVLGRFGPSSGIYNLADGQAHFANATLGVSGPGTINMSGGLLVVTNIFDVGTVGGAAVLNHTGGTLSAGELNFGNGATTTPTATLTGGLHLGTAWLPNQANATTAVRVRGGTVDVAGNVAVDAGTLLEVSGPTIEVNNGGAPGTATDGAMRVAGSSVAVNGTATVDAGLGTLNVLSATLSGTGVINAKTNVFNGSTLAPGSSPGILTLNGDTALDVTSTFAVEIENITSYDAINVNGALTLGGAYLQGTTVGVLNIVAGELYFIGRNDGVDPVTGLFSLSLGGAPINDGDIVTFGIAQFKISYDADFAANTLNGGNDIALEAQTTIPEPGSAMLLGLGALVLARRRRKTA